ncbi:cardiolipin synthase [Rhodoferax sp. OV413]|uniref:phospholipase D-like domain-containing protein n=1 Tax=Rhodoferax sp. OV413 TaxID=1855285 RepID=UPI00087E77BF|nr:phospholipase D-like domain-containing protein [Rhodoferax sp. OV413]SDO32830.1 cardiolipin synthase [Rhodoferax sp. OV413]
MHFFRPRRLSVLSILAIVLATMAASLLAVNFIGGEKKIEQHVTRAYSIADPRFAQELGVLLGRVFLPGSQTQVLLNGDQIFPSMLQAIRSAQKTITFETYIYWSGEVGQQFADALAERARHGVKTHLLLDWVGSAKMDEKLLDEMRSAGVQIQKFHPPHWSHLGRLNNRTHRKLLVVDGQVGFTGGVGIAPEWTGQAQDPGHWRDTHFRIEGPVVAQLQAVFLDNWVKVTGDVLHGPSYFPPLAPVGDHVAQMFSSSPTGGSDSMQLMYLMAIGAADRSIDLSAAYFVPDALTTRALLAALQRGVKLRVVVPGEHIDSETVRSASRAKWGPLLSAGAVIAEYAPTMYHCKVMVVDDLFVSVGSTNFDNRSFRLNDEATLNIISPSFAQQQKQIFEADLAQSRRITLEQWNNRPLRERVGEWYSGLIASQL